MPADPIASAAPPGSTALIPLHSMQLATGIFAVSMLLTLLAARRIPAGT